MKSRVGLFGGTFDPVHLGHLQLATLARKMCSLDEVCFVPAAVPPHKDCSAVAGFQHRVEMLRLAITHDSCFSLSTVEQNLPKPSYTIDTLRHFLSQPNPSPDFFFLVGSDSFLAITTWKSWRDLLQLAHFVVFMRGEDHTEKLHALLRQLCFVPEGDSSCWHHPLVRRDVIVPAIAPGVIMDISSTQIRQKIDDREGVAPLLHPDVFAYIQAHQLYRI